MNTYLKNLGRHRYYQLVVGVLLLSDFSLAYHLYESFVVGYDNLSANIMALASEQMRQSNLDAAFVREIMSTMVNSLLTAVLVFIFINIVNYLFFLRGKKFSYKYTMLILKLSIPLSFFTSYTLSKKLDLTALIYLLEGFAFCLLAYAARFYPYPERDDAVKAS